MLLPRATAGFCTPAPTPVPHCATRWQPFVCPHVCAHAAQRAGDAHGRTQPTAAEMCALTQLFITAENPFSKVQCFVLNACCSFTASDLSNFASLAASANKTRSPAVRRKRNHKQHSAPHRDPRPLALLRIALQRPAGSTHTYVVPTPGDANRSARRGAHLPCYKLGEHFVLAHACNPKVQTATWVAFPVQMW